MHSPWGIAFNIIEKTGFSWDYLNWKIRWIHVLMMQADAPGYKKGKPQAKEISTEDEFKAFFE